MVLKSRWASVILLSLLTTLIWGQNDELRDEINKIIKYDTEIDFEETPGFIVGIIDGDSRFTLEFGFADLNKTEKLTQNSIFELGSITKVFLSSLISILEEESLLSYDEKINSMLLKTYRNNSLDHLTIGSLLNHTSGFPILPTGFGTKQTDVQNPYQNYKKSDLLEYYKGFSHKSSGKGKKQECVYSHLNFALLEIALEHKFKKTLQDLFDEYLFNPMALHATFIDSPKEYKISPGYDRNLKKVYPWNFSSFKGSEGMKSNLKDLMDFINAQMDPKNDYSKIFSKGHQMEVPTIYNKRLYLGKGWHIIKNKGHYSIISHTGKTTGHQAYVSFIKETRTGVIILCNSSHGVEDLGFLILRMINYNWRRKK